jgi:hypothetical protein
MTLGADYSHQHRQCFDRDFQILTSSLRGYVEELQNEQANERLGRLPVPATTSAANAPTRVFISHAAPDAPFVEELIEILEMIGLTHEQIFCTSFPGYGIDLGDNFLEAIKAELLNTNALVLFVLTPRFYASPACLSEMGATWVLAKEHIPILVPPFEFSDVKGVIPLTQGFKLNEPLKLNLFREKIQAVFELAPTLTQSAWERKRDRVVERLNAKIAAMASER